MVEGDKVRYGQRKWDSVVVPEQLGYIDEEGNERDMSDGYHKYKGSFPDIDIRYRHDQDMSGETKTLYLGYVGWWRAISTIEKET